MMTEKVQKERWPRQDYLSVDAILNYWFDGDEEKMMIYRHLLRDACMVGYVGCVINCDEDESVGTLFDRKGRDLLIERKTFEEWVAGSERLVRNSEKPANWWDQIFIDNDRKDREREEKKKKAQALQETEKTEKQRLEIEERARIETEARLKAEQEFKKNSNKRNAGDSLQGQSEYNCMKLVGALYEIFVEKIHGEVDVTQKQQLIDFILEKYPNVYGLKERSLHSRIKDAKRIITSEKE